MIARIAARSPQVQCWRDIHEVGEERGGERLQEGPHAMLVR
jgi:hypothetical protein